MLPKAAGSRKAASSEGEKKYKGIVKFVNSGDWVTIRGERGTPPPEKTLALLYISAPKLAHRKTEGQEESVDEPWAWEAREYLRKKLIGKTVVYTERKILGHSYGWIWIGTRKTSENVSELMVKRGYASVHHNVKHPSALLIRLIELEAQARQAQVGIWSAVSPRSKVRRVIWEHDRLDDLIARYQNRPANALIEHVRDGSTVRAFLLPDKPNEPHAEYNYVTLAMSGIRCPTNKIDESGRVDKKACVPYAEEARHFVECRLLHHEVRIVLEYPLNSKLVGTILHWRGNIALSLLREGLAQCTQIPAATDANKYLMAEAEAKMLRKRLWKDYKPHVERPLTKKKFSGVVVEVLHGVAIHVLMADGVEEKVYFSSVRSPKWTDFFGAEDEKPVRRLFDVPWVLEAREFLRNLLLCRMVSCSLDFVHENAQRNFYTVLYNGRNVAEMLLAKGFVYLSREEASYRSSQHERLVAAWNSAKEKNVGVHSKEVPVSRGVVDLAKDVTLLKQYFSSWHRSEEPLKAIVESVVHGSRLQIYIPKENCLVFMNLSGIVCPNAGAVDKDLPAEVSQLYAVDALDFTRFKVLQRNVTVRIGFMSIEATSVHGWLWSPQGENIAEALVSEGLAKVVGIPSKSPYYGVLIEAQQTAMAAKKNIWSQSNVALEASVSAEESTKEEESVQKVVISRICDDLTFYAQFLDNAGDYEVLREKLQTFFNDNPPLMDRPPPKKGDFCAALFSYDRLWYRAIVLSTQADKVSAMVQYVDFGNTEWVSFQDLVPLPDELKRDDPYALPYALALIKAPPEEDEIKELQRQLTNRVLNQVVELHLELQPARGLPLAKLVDPSSGKDIGLQLIGEGFATVDEFYKDQLSALYLSYTGVQQKVDELGSEEATEIPTPV